MPSQVSFLLEILLRFFSNHKTNTDTLRYLTILNNLYNHRSIFHSFFSAFSASRPKLLDNIKMDLEEIGISAGNWVDSVQDRNYC